jgi:hypothetical protein
VNKPAVTEGIGFVNYAWPELGLRIVAERYDDDGHAELTVFHNNGSGELMLHSGKAYLLSTREQSSWAKRLQKNLPDAPWEDILTAVGRITVEIARRGEPVKEIYPSDQDNLEVGYLLKPLIYLNHPNVIFGDYGSLKSLLSIVIAYAIQLPWHDNRLGLTPLNDSTVCLYLDYEDDEISFRKRLSALEKGLGEGIVSIYRRKMTAPLADSIDSLQRIIDNKKIGLLIIDSLGPAARGNLNDPEPAIRYHAALRQLGVTSLTLAHTAKDQITKKRTIFGSVFFTNLARSVWECKAEQETGEDEAIISLRHTKANLSRLYPTLGYRFNFSNDTISVEKTDLKDTGLSGELPLSLRIKDLLRGGAMTVKEIAETLEANEASIKTIVNRMAKKGVTVKVGDSWGLIAL